MAQKMIPAIWLRLIVVILFTIFVAWQGMWFIAVVGALLALMSAYQLIMAYRESRK
ncbi:hypothetical protein [Corynebacterium lubricantis]|uniref:hypothetical protein n=1 Tax=Corynebacterium lubricantis TaxID=541095 RepID=UPI0003775192|nr:hypothetical protein [Corynebacterium lubricantis]